MRNWKNMICFALALIFIFSIPVSAAGESNVSSGYSLYFHSYSTYLWRISSTEFEVWFEVTARGVMDELGASYIEVQRSTNGTTWTTVATYEPDDYPQMICKNTGMHAECVPYVMTSGYQYRAVVTYYAKSGAGSGTFTADAYFAN